MKKEFMIKLILCFSLTHSVVHAQTYTYDDFNRLTHVEYNDGTLVNFQYDKLGNRTGYTVTPGNGTCTPNLSISGAVLTKKYHSAGELNAQNANVSNGKDVELVSDTGVLLETEFSVELGAELDAYIEPCPPNVNQPSTENAKKKKEE